MAALGARAQFGERLFENALLRFDEALEIVRVVHRCPAGADERAGEVALAGPSLKT
jgi:hypothetical protein